MRESRNCIFEVFCKSNQSLEFTYIFSLFLCGPDLFWWISIVIEKICSDSGSPENGANLVLSIWPGRLPSGTNQFQCQNGGRKKCLATDAAYEYQ
jgi:hypothetical protein